MPFDIPSLDDVHQFALNEHRRLLPELDVSEESHNWKWSRVAAGVVSGNFAHTNAVSNDVMPDTATGEMADRWGGLRGVARKTASPARKARALRFVGTPTTTVPDGTLLVHQPSRLQFRTVGNRAIGTLGTVDVDVVAVDLGSKTRLPAGEVLTLQQPIAGVHDEAELQHALDEGGDNAELDATYVPRYLERWRNPPLGGTASDFVKFATDAREVGGGGAAAAFCYPLRAGLGTVDVAALHAGSGGFRILTEAERAELFARMNARRPVAMRGFRLLTVQPQQVHVEVTIVDDGTLASAFDWNDRNPPTMQAWNADTRTLTFTQSRPSTMQAGQRITISDGLTGRERVIEATVGANAVILEADNDGDVPTFASVFYAGGPLVEPARQAVQRLFDNLGTSNPDSRRYGPWEGSLRPTALGRAITSVAGVLDLGALVTPTATVVAADPAPPNNTTVGLLIAGRILIRKA